jgi:hypothetical protein
MIAAKVKTHFQWCILNCQDSAETLKKLWMNAPTHWHNNTQSNHSTCAQGACQVSKHNPNLEDDSEYSDSDYSDATEEESDDLDNDDSSNDDPDDDDLDDEFNDNNTNPNCTPRQIEESNLPVFTQNHLTPIRAQSNSEVSSEYPDSDDE